MKKLFTLLFVLIASLLILCSCECKHTEATDATCISPSQCLSCGETVSEALGHTKGSDATCTKPAICIVCNETIAKAIGHTEGDWIIDAAATCTEDGNKHQICSVCNETIKTETLPKLGHTESDWIIDVEATCSEQGSKHNVCLVCNEVVSTKKILKLSHTPGDWVVDKEKVTQNNCAKAQFCTVCNTKLKLESSSVKHTEGQWITTQEPTCTKVGRTELLCSVCNTAYKLNQIAKISHESNAEATCTAPSVCTMCDLILAPALGHDAKLLNIEASDSGYSIAKLSCTRCQSTFEETISELSVSVAQTSSSMATINGYGSYSRTYSASASGGYGEYQYKFEVFSTPSSSSPISHLTQDFSSSSSCTLSTRNSYGFGLSGYILKVTVKDSIGNQKEYIYQL
ncbi:MAG: hypothetical protein IJY39_07810 [Clostridia bacterium]|nr:hypothetical protein [Clostridia bacterium]